MNDPIKEFIQDNIFFPVETYTKKNALLYVRESFTKLDDSLLPFSSTKNMTFLAVDSILQFTSALDYYNGVALVNVMLRIDTQYDVYT